MHTMLKRSYHLEGVVFDKRKGDRMLRKRAHALEGIITIPFDRNRYYSRQDDSVENSEENDRKGDIRIPRRDLRGTRPRIHY